MTITVYDINNILSSILHVGWIDEGIINKIKNDIDNHNVSDRIIHVGTDEASGIAGEFVHPTKYRKYHVRITVGVNSFSITVIPV